MKRVVVRLLLGVVTTVGVAWGLAAAMQATTTPSAAGWDIEYASSTCPVPFGVHTHWLIRHVSKAGASLRVLTCVEHPGRADRSFDELFPPIRGLHQDITTLESRAGSDPSHPGFVYWDGRGWPFTALAAHWSWFGSDDWPEVPVVGGIDLSSPQATWPWPFGVHELRALPLTPVWPGFAIDTIFFAALGFALFFGPGLFKRWNRTRRGLCPMCNYDLRGNKADSSQPTADSRTSAGCPECGWGRVTDHEGG